MFAGKPADQRADLRDLQRIQPGRGFIQDEDIRISQQRLCQPHSLPVTLGQVADEPICHLFDPRLLHDLYHTGFPFSPGNAPQLRRKM